MANSSCCCTSIGDIYYNEAGTIGIVDVTLYDRFDNLIPIDGNYIDVTLYNSSLVSSPVISAVRYTSNGNYQGIYNASVAGIYNFSVYVADVGLCISYYNFSDPQLDLIHSDTAESVSIITDRATLNYSSVNTNSSHPPFRLEYFSARFIGLLTPQTAELFKFFAVLDSSSSVRLYLGPSTAGDSILGPQNLALVFSSQNQTSAVGEYLFEAIQPYNIVIEYSHGEDNPLFELFWESPSISYSIVPSFAFRHWSLAFNSVLAIFPAKLNPSSSIAIGLGLEEAIAGQSATFSVITKDEFGNNLSVGGDEVSAFAVGSDGSTLRGIVTDNNNGVYSVEYFPITSGTYLLYVSLGCCPRNPSVGITNEISGLQENRLLISNAPFILTVRPTDISPTYCFLSDLNSDAIAGDLDEFFIHARDMYHNPTSFSNYVVNISFISSSDRRKFSPASLDIAMNDASIAKVTYNITYSGTMQMYVRLCPMSESNQSNTSACVNIGDSPALIVRYPSKPCPRNTRAQGSSLIKSSADELSSFELQLFDIYKNRYNMSDIIFFIRLYGEVSSAVNASSTYLDIPYCQGQGHGRYICFYNAKYKGLYELDVKLLNSSIESLGGQGVVIEYYSAVDLDNNHPILVSSLPSIDISLPLGNLIPSRSLSLGYATLPVQGVGQGVRITGYLVAPSTDSYSFQIISNNLNVTLFLDDNILWDSESCHSYDYPAMQGGYSTCFAGLSLRGNSSYKLTLKATTLNEIDYPISLKLLWKSSQDSNYRIIPKYYLYDSAESISHSKFRILVT